jgi:ATP-dependent helicase/nuclease subunit A
LLVTGDEVMVVDYKSNRPPPGEVAETPAVYLRQMAAYRAVLGEVYPGKSIRCALLWTAAPKLVELPEAMLATYAVDQP